MNLPDRVLVTGSSGLIGSALCSHLKQCGSDVLRLVRREPESRDERSWDIATRRLDPRDLQGVSAVVHLAGEGIAARRWSNDQRERIRSSRVHGTRLLVNTMRGMNNPPGALICASSHGIYGNRGAEVLTEDSRIDDQFPAGTAAQWEAAAREAAEFGTRVVSLRFGIVMSSAGGALHRMLPAFRLGLGGVMGTGRQYISWISLADAVGVIDHALSSASLSGPVNAVAPNPLTNRDFTNALAKAVGKPACLRVPSIVIKAVLGEMGKSLLLDSYRVIPQRLLGDGYRFRHAHLESALATDSGGNASVGI